MRRLFSLGSMAATFTKTESSTTDGSEVSANPVDPEVVEYFKYFPEPYRQHAIERYSKHDGLYRWKIFRDLDMNNEKVSALKGVFLEDIRRAEQLAQIKEQEAIEQALDEKKAQFYEREIPNWEQRLLQYISLQPSDTMKSKLFDITLYSFGGLGSLILAAKSFKQPGYTRWQSQVLLVTGTILCINLHITAAARLKDLGPFDRSVDDRHVSAKLREEIKKRCEFFLSSLNNSSSRP